LFQNGQTKTLKHRNTFVTPDCTQELNVINIIKDIKTIDFFGERDDVVIFSTEEGIFALELDNRQYHNVQEIYDRSDPDFRLSSKNTMFIKRKDQYYTLKYK